MGYRLGDVAIAELAKATRLMLLAKLMLLGKRWMSVMRRRTTQWASGLMFLSPDSVALVALWEAPTHSLKVL
jgi:hypothetical protein